jgi:internalin A
MSKPANPAELTRLIDQAAAEGWEELDLSGMELEVLPAEISKLTGLKKLVLGKVNREQRKLVGNALTEIPKVIFELTQLQEL